MEAGADLGAFNRDILTAMDIAADRNHLLVECYLRTEGASSSGQFWNAADTGGMDSLPVAPCLRYCTVILGLFWLAMMTTIYIIHIPQVRT